MGSSPGQASSDYVALLCIVALALAGSAVAAPDIPRALAHHSRVALCIVGGDICRSSDAARAGYAPCVTDSRDDSRRLSATVLVVRLGEDRSLVTERLSDGTFVVSDVVGRDLSGSVGVGGHIGPVGAEAGASGGERWRSGRSWVLPDEAARRDLLARIRTGRRLPPATHRFFAGGQFLEAEARGAGSSARAAGDHWLGRRVGRGLTTWYRDVSFDARAAFGPMLGELSASRRQSWVLEATRDGRGELRAFVFRGSLARRSGEVTEIRGALDLSVPGNREAARDLLSLEEGRGLLPALLAMRHRLNAGAIERAVYSVREQGSRYGIGAGLGIEIEGEYGSRTVTRRLLRADVLQPGGRRARRVDCSPLRAGITA